MNTKTSSTTPTERELQLQQAVAAQEAGDLPKAGEILKALLKQYPEFAAGHAQAGQLLMLAGRYRAAEQHLIKVAELLPNIPQGWRNLAAFYLRRKRWNAVVVAARKQLQLMPKDTVALQQLALAQKELKEYTAALKSVDQVGELGEKSPELDIFKAQLLALAGRDDESFALFETLLTAQQLPVKHYSPWVRYCLRSERTERAIEWLRQRLQREPESIEALLMLCGALIPEGRYREALEALRIVERLAPDDFRTHHDLGVVLRFMGQMEESHRHMLKALEIDPYNVSAMRIAGAEHRYVYGDAEFSRLMRAAVQLPKYSQSAKVQLHYTLGKAFDDVDDLAVAFDHYAEAGRLHLQSQPKQADTMETYHAFAKKRLTKALMENPSEQGYESDIPVFILGMPRSGTSLVEQVLASHPAVFGAGELKYFSRAMDGAITGGMRLEMNNRAPIFPKGSDATWATRGKAYVDYLKSCLPKDSNCSRVIDKMPGNYMWAGVIHQLLPKAKIIHTRRHPVETCLSAYRIYFPDGILWSYDLKKLGQAYRHYWELMAHWRAVLPEGVMHEVRYEDMVNDLPAQARLLVKHCALPWDGACLDFHNTDRPVRTASASQVRKPVYKTSMNRWRKYEPYLRPLLQELGPLVQQYEDELGGK